MKKQFFLIVLVSFNFLIPQSAVHVPITGTIDMGLPSYIQRAIDSATEDSAQYIIFDIDTFGGRVDAATQIKDAILSSEVTTVAFINRRAISAGALISLSCDSIFMTPGSTIGAATAVDLQGEKASEKIISYMREEMAASAEATNRARDIAEAMVDEEISIPFLLTVSGDTLTATEIEGFNEGKLVTLSTQNALKLGFANGEIESYDFLLDRLGIAKNDTNQLRESWSEMLVRFLTNPNVAPLFMSLGMLGLFFEIKSPGFGVPGSLGLLCLALFFGSHLLVGLANSTEVLLLFGGLFFILLEIIVIPGFGIAGIPGFLLILYALYKMMLGEYPLPEDIRIATRSLSISFTTMIVFGALIFQALTRTEYYKKLVPITSQKSSEGYSISKGLDNLVGQRGKVLTDLRPSGKIQIENNTYQAMSTGNYINVGETVIVEGTDENQLIVNRLNT